MDNAMGKSGNPIKLSKSILDDIQQTIATTVHELTHNVYGTVDMTEDMVHKIGLMASRLLVDYLLTEYNTSVIANGVGNNNIQFKISIPKKLADNEHIHKGSNVRVSLVRED
jgi:hypothetical protein